MFKKSGSTVRTIGKVFWVLGVIGTVIVGIVSMFSDMLLGFLTIVFGLISCYVSSIMYVAIGDAAEKSSLALDAITDLSRQFKNALPNTGEVIRKGTAVPHDINIKCKECGATQFPGRTNCYNCGAELKK